MKICPSCGYREEANWRSSRFDYNSEYLRFSEAMAKEQLKEICEQLKNRANFDRIVVGPYSYYRRGKGGLFLYRVPNEDFRVHRERKKH